MPTLVIPNTFVAKTRAKAVEVNENFDAIKDLLNTTKIDTNNIQEEGVELANLSASVQALLNQLPGTSGFVTTLPASPINGQMVVYQVTEGVNWLLRYNSASASDYKWECIGGTPVVSTAIADTVPISQGSYGTVSSPSLTLALPGDYDLEHSGAMRWQTGASGLFGYTTLAYAGSAATSGTGSPPATSTEEEAVTFLLADGRELQQYRRFKRKTAITAASTVAVMHQVSTGAMVVSARVLSAMPVRVKKP